MFSDKYLFTPNGKRIYKIVNEQIVSSILHCPNCGKNTGKAELIEESGYMAKYLVYRCVCNTVYKEVN